MRISSSNIICLIVGVLVLSVQCLFFMKSWYMVDIRVLQSKVASLAREKSLLRDRRLTQQQNMAEADKLLLSRLRAMLTNYHGNKQASVESLLSVSTTKSTIQRSTASTGPETSPKSHLESQSSSKLTAAKSTKKISTPSSSRILKTTKSTLSKLAVTTATPSSDTSLEKTKTTPGGIVT